MVIGSSSTDMIIKGDHIPHPGETILGGQFASVAGGKGAIRRLPLPGAGVKSRSSLVWQRHIWGGMPSPGLPRGH